MGLARRNIYFLPAYVSVCLSVTASPTVTSGPSHGSRLFFKWENGPFLIFLCTVGRLPMWWANWQQIHIHERSIEHKRDARCEKFIHISNNSDSEKTNVTASILWLQGESDIFALGDIYYFQLVCVNRYMVTDINLISVIFKYIWYMTYWTDTSLFQFS